MSPAGWVDADRVGGEGREAPLGLKGQAQPLQAELLLASL